MALFKSQLVTQISGSVGGTTYSHSSSGMYMRGRTIPVNPQTARQLLVRNAIGMYSQMWESTLTQSQRDAWDLFGTQVALTNVLGDQFFASGQNHYIRANVPREQVNTELVPATLLTAINDAPTTFMLPTLAAPTYVYNAALDACTVTFDDTASWVNDDENALLIYEGRPRTASRKFFKGPYRLLAAIQGDVAAPPVSPFVVATVSDAYPIVAGQVVKTRSRLTVGEVTDQPTGLSAFSLYDGAVI